MRINSSIEITGNQNRPGRETMAWLVLVSLVVFLALSVPIAFGGQGAQRMLYTVPNNSFVENPSGDNVVTVNDTSGSVTTLQALIANARTANPSAILAIHLLNGATYWVNNNSGGLVLGAQECLIGTGATIEATNVAVTNTLVLISSGATNVSIAGGTLNANGADIYGIYAPASAARVNIDKVTVLNCGQDCIQLNGTGSGAFDNEMTVTRCDLSGNSGHSGISLWNATQTVCVDNYCHGNSVGIWLGNCSYASVANNTCSGNGTGIDCNSGSDNYVANNTCTGNGTGIYAGGSGNMAVSDALGSNTIAGISSQGSGNIYVDNLFTAGNATNFINGGSGDDVVSYEGTLNGSGQNYFYPPLISNQHTNTIVNGMGRYDLYDDSTTTIDTIQSEYNAAISGNPNDVIVLHLNGSYTVGGNPLTLNSDTCVLLGGMIQINSSTTASCAVTAPSGAGYISISGGTIDGGSTTPPSNGRDAIYFSGVSMFQIDGMTLQNFGNSRSRVGGSDVVRIDHGNTPRIVTRCTINGGSARGIWVATSGPRDVISDNTVTDVQMDGVDCDESTSSSLVKFNYLHNNGRYGVFLEQSASYNLVLGNICNYDSSYDIGCYNNSATPRGATAYNSVICNSLLGDNDLRNGSTGTNTVTSSDNFFFNNTVMSANIQSQLYGSQNYYSQNYMGNSLLSTSGTEVFFNPPDVSGNLQVQDHNSGLDAIVQNAATTNAAPVITGNETGLGNNLWQLLPTDSGYYRLMNENSGLALVVLGASTNAGAPIIQWTYDASGNDEWMPVPAGNGLYSFINRLSGLNLDVTGASVTPGTQLDQQSATGAANQQFNLIDTPTTTASSTSNAVSWTGGGAPDGDWSNPENWGGAVPLSGDWLVFGSGSQLVATNDLAAGTAFCALSFNGNAPAFTLYGNGLVLSNVWENNSGTNSGGTMANASINSQTVNLPVTLSAGNHVIATAGGAGALVFGGTLSRPMGALAQFSLGGGAVNAILGNVNAIIGGWAVVSTAGNLVNNNGSAGTVNWATANSGAVIALASYTAITGSGAAIPNETGNNVNITTDGSSADTLGTSGVTDMNTLYFSATGNNLQLNIGSGQTLRLGAEGGIMANSPKYSTIGSGSSGTVTAGGGANAAGELSLYNCSYYSGGGLVINAVIGDNGAGYPVAVNILGSANYNYANTYSGGTYLNEGELYLQSGATCGSGPIYIFPGGRVDFGGNNSATITNNFYLQGYGFVVAGEPGAIKGPYNGKLTGTITLLNNASIDPNAGSGTNTCNFTGLITGPGSLTVGGPSSGFVAGTATFWGTNNYTGDAIVDATANQNGGAGIRMAGGKNNLMQNGGGLILIGGSTGVAGFDLNGTTQSVNTLVATNGMATNAVVKSSGNGGLLSVGGNGASSTFGGVLTNGPGTLSLTKTGAGNLTLAGRNTYTGNTLINAGTLALSGAGSISNSAFITVATGATLDASGRTDQTFTLNNGQTLEGDGAVNVNLVVNSGATVMPGSSTSVGALTVASAAQLQGVTVMKLNAASGTSDQINASSVIYGGSLVVSNLSGAFSAGQNFQLFLSGTYAGTFSSLSLPSLGAGLAWNTSLLSTGVLQVVSTTPPQPYITGIMFSGSNLVFNGTNGVNGEACILLDSTNVTLPFNQWTPVLTSVISSGNFSLTNPVVPGGSQNFYLLQIQVP